MPKRFCWAIGRRRAELRAPIAALLALLPTAAAACDFSGLPHRLTSPRATLAWRADPALTVGVPHAIEVGLCDARLVGVDAFMPAHGHGTNYRTEIVAAGAGRFRAEGLLLHMPGRWQLIFDVETASGRERLVQELEIE